MILGMNGVKVERIKVLHSIFVGVIWDIVSDCIAVVGGRMIPKDVHSLIPKISEYVNWKKNFPNVIKSRSLQMADYPGLSECAQYNYEDSKK